MEIIKRCKITRYDNGITRPPFLTIKIDEVNVPKPEIDDLGRELYERLYAACRMKGYFFKFYTTADDEYDYELVVE